jgi:hypothetical protein
LFPQIEEVLYTFLYQVLIGTYSIFKLFPLITFPFLLPRKLFSFWAFYLHGKIKYQNRFFTFFIHLFTVFNNCIQRYTPVYRQKHAVCSDFTAIYIFRRNYFRRYILYFSGYQIGEMKKIKPLCISMQNLCTELINLCDVIKTHRYENNNTRSEQMSTTRNQRMGC